MLSSHEMKIHLAEATAMHLTDSDGGSSAASAMSTDLSPMRCNGALSRQASFHSSASSACEAVSVASDGSSIESTHSIANHFSYDNLINCHAPLDISLKIHDSTGKAQILKFVFDLHKDSFESVAREMVLDLQLSENAVSRIASKIEQSVRKEQAKRTHQLLLASAAPVMSPVNVDVSRPLSRSSLELVATQHHALADRHMQRMCSLLTQSRRRSALELASSGDSIGSDDAQQQSSKVRFCKLRGIYVPDVVKSKN
eukprot:scaffold181254_cov40-Prasinocladus_malaysianus.AAC.3